MTDLPLCLIKPFNLEQFLAAVHDALSTVSVLNRRTKIQHSPNARTILFFCINN